MTVEEVVSAFERLMKEKQGQPLFFFTLRHYNWEHGQRWMLRISKYIKQNRSRITGALSQRLQSKYVEIRVAVSHDRVYIWRRHVNPLSYEHVLRQELFFFTKRNHRMLVNQARKSLGIKGNYDLSSLARDLTDYGDTAEERRERIISDFHPNSAHLKGETLKLFLDTQKATLRSIEPLIERIGVGKQIVKPRILSDEEFLEIIARLFAIVGSDGSVDTNHRVFYYEDNQDRRNRVRQHLLRFGVIATPTIRRRDGRRGGFKMPGVIGRILSKMGMPVGDKVFQGVRLPDWLLQGSSKIQLAYLEELIPEEGWVTIDDKDYGRIGWSRSVVLHDIAKSKKFNIQRQLPLELVDFTQAEGTPEVRTYGKKGVSDIFRKLTMSDLRRLQKSSDPHIARKAQDLEKIVRKAKSGYLEDERTLCKRNGIFTTRSSPTGIAYSEQTGRVSVRWGTATASQEDVAKWGLLALPNDNRKRKILTDWMKRHPETVDRARIILHKKEAENGFSA